MRILYTFFGIYFFAFLLIQFRGFLGIDVPDWVLFYGKDFLCMPIVLTICLFFAQRIKKSKKLRLSFLSIFSLTAFYSIYFELYLPEVHLRYTADVVDVLMYSAGSLLFYFSQRIERNPKESREGKRSQDRS